MPQQRSYELLYGPTGSPVLQNRFALAGDPRPSIPIVFAGGMVSNSPAHTIGLDGTAYRYGATVVGGTQNLFPISGQMTTPPLYDQSLGNSTTYWILGKAAPFDSTANCMNYRALIGINPGYVAGGELIGAGVLGSWETFTTAGTVAITQGNAHVIGTGTAWTTNTLSNYPAPFNYTPSLNVISPGDILKITHASGTIYYRIKSVVSNTDMIVEATPGSTIADASQSGMAYTIYRTGFGSNSRVVPVIPIPPGTNTWYYYGANNVIQAMNPQTAAHAMAPTGQNATDVAMYKTFMLYGYGNTIGWSVAGFPTAYPFGATDFPALNIAVLPTDGQGFVGFEFLGDQLVAIFNRSVWQINATGGVPEFTFYKLPEVTGAELQLNLSQGITLQTVDPAFRPTVTTRGADYYLSGAGLMELSGQVAHMVSEPVNDILPPNGNLHWDPVSDTVMIEDQVNPILMYHRPTQSWGRLPWHIGFVADSNQTTALPQFSARRLRFGHYDAATKSVLGMRFDKFGAPLDRPGTAAEPWSVATPVINLSDVYGTYVVGGFRIDAEHPGGSAAVLTWTLYGGASPYSLTSRGTGTYNYAIGTTSSRDLIQPKIDDAFIAITISATSTSTSIYGVSLYLTAKESKG